MVAETLISNRFDLLLRGNSTHVYDQPLIQTSSYIVAPSLGALVPGWLIVVPRTNALNFRDLAAATGDNPEGIVKDVLTYLQLEADEVIWFEHGPAQFGTLVGCGADYAHIHIIIRPAFSFADLVEAAERMAGKAWFSAKSDSVYTALSQMDSYVVVSQADEARHITNVEGLGSQFMRRVIASLSDQTTEWDYKKYPHASNIDETVAMVRALERNARRD